MLSKRLPQKLVKKWLSSCINLQVADNSISCLTCFLTLFINSSTISFKKKKNQINKQSKCAHKVLLFSSEVILVNYGSKKKNSIKNFLFVL